MLKVHGTTALVLASALLAGCGGARMAPAPAAGGLEQAAVHPAAACGNSHAGCRPAALVAPLAFTFGSSGLTLSLDAAMCKHVHLRHRGALPLDAGTFTLPRTGRVPVSITAFADPCHPHEHRRIAPDTIATPSPSPAPTSGPANTRYYVAALSLDANGRYVFAQLAGPANEDDSRMLTFSSPNSLAATAGTAYAFYLVRGSGKH